MFIQNEKDNRMKKILLWVGVIAYSLSFPLSAGVDVDTKIETEDGAKELALIKAGDKVATLNAMLKKKM